MLRLVGVLLLSLGILVAQMIHLDIEAYYPATLLMRSPTLDTFLWLYLRVGDRLFLVLTGIVGLGFVLSIEGYLGERKNP